MCAALCAFDPFPCAPMRINVCACVCGVRVCMRCVQNGRPLYLERPCHARGQTGLSACARMRCVCGGSNPGRQARAAGAGFVLPHAPATTCPSWFVACGDACGGVQVVWRPARPELRARERVGGWVGVRGVALPFRAMAWRGGPHTTPSRSPSSHVTTSVWSSLRLLPATVPCPCQPLRR